MPDNSIMPQLNLPWLEVSILTPLIGALICRFIDDQKKARLVAVAFSFVALLMTCAEWYDFGLLHAFQAHDSHDVVRWLFAHDVFVIDELNAPLLPLTGLLYALTILATLPTQLGRFSFSSTLLSQAIVVATLSCHDPWLIIALLACACLPVWFELRRRGAKTRMFSLYMGLSTALLVLGFSLVDPSAGAQSAPALATALMTLAVLLRAGIFPLHSWMSDLFEHATFGTALLFVAPMTGAYAVMHLLVPYSPSWGLQSIAILSLLTSVYAAAMASIQRESRRFFCFLFLSNASLVLAGLEVVTTIGLTGALCVWFSVGISLGGFALTLRAIEARIGRVRLDQYHGLYEHTPTLAGLFMLTGLASIGFPGTIGFIGLELLTEGAVGVYPVVGLAVVLAATLNGIAIMRAYFLIFTGRKFRTVSVLRISSAERLAVGVLSILLIGGGLWPQPGIASRHHAAESLMRRRESAERAAVADAMRAPHTSAPLSKVNHVRGKLSSVAQISDSTPLGK